MNTHAGAREAENEDTFDTSTALMPRTAEGMRNLRDFLSAPAREQVWHARRRRLSTQNLHKP